MFTYTSYGPLNSSGHAVGRGGDILSLLSSPPAPLDALVKFVSTAQHDVNRFSSNVSPGSRCSMRDTSHAVAAKCFFRNAAGGGPTSVFISAASRRLSSFAWPRTFLMSRLRLLLHKFIHRNGPETQGFTAFYSQCSLWF